MTRSSWVYLLLFFFCSLQISRLYELWQLIFCYLLTVHRFSEDGFSVKEWGRSIAPQGTHWNATDSNWIAYFPFQKAWLVDILLGPLDMNPRSRRLTTKMLFKDVMMCSYHRECELARFPIFRSTKGVHLRYCACHRVFPDEAPWPLP